MIDGYIGIKFDKAELSRDTCNVEHLCISLLYGGKLVLEVVSVVIEEMKGFIWLI